MPAANTVDITSTSYREIVTVTPVMGHSVRTETAEAEIRYRIVESLDIRTLTESGILLVQYLPRD